MKRLPILFVLLTLLSLLKGQEEVDSLTSIQADSEYLRKVYSTELKFSYLLLSGIVVLLIGSTLYFRRSVNRHKVEQEELKQELEQLQKTIVTQSIASVESNKVVTLSKARIEQVIGAKLGESSWMILNCMYKNPSISNKEIAEEVSLSVEGVSSSLRRMYVTFDLKASSNKRIMLVTKAVEYSMGNKRL